MAIKLILFAVIGISSIYAQSECPPITSRADWNAKSPKKALTDLTCKPAPYVVIHHSATPPCSNSNECKQRIQSFQTHHIDVNKWADIGYNFLIGGDGGIYEGRGWTKSGAHAPEYNKESIAICLIGNFTGSTPTVAAQEAAKKLIRCGVLKNHIKDDYKLIGHSQIQQTECPGESLYNIIKTWVHYESNPKPITNC